MEVRMEHTQGLGREAEVWLGELLMTVCDGVSRPDKRCPPGAMDNVTFSYMTAEGTSWDQAARANPGMKKKLEPLRGYSYLGYGQVVSVMPVVIDFGLMRMQDANWTSDEELVGRFVAVNIDRLEISFADEPDWPEGM